MTDVLALRAMVDGLAESGVTDVIVCPGSRSTPLALATRAHPGLRVRVLLDERSTGFFALGLARASRRPVAVVVTSGTAVANLLPAVVEASLARVPLVLLTADRPPELRDRGAPQTIDQVRIFGGYVRWFAEMPLLDGAHVTLLAQYNLQTMESWDGPYDPAPRPGVGAEMIVPQVEEQMMRIQQNLPQLNEIARDQLPETVGDLIAKHFAGRLDSMQEQIRQCFVSVEEIEQRKREHLELMRNSRTK